MKLGINVGTKIETQSDVCELLGREGLWELSYDDWPDGTVPRIGENLILPITDFSLKASPHGNEIVVRVNDVMYWVEDGQPEISIGTTALRFA